MERSIFSKKATFLTRTKANFLAEKSPSQRKHHDQEVLENNRWVASSRGNEDARKKNISVLEARVESGGIV
jgi:hypothetical protein